MPQLTFIEQDKEEIEAMTKVVVEVEVETIMTMELE